MVAAAAGQSRHRRAQPAAQAEDPALQAGAAAAADRAADVRSRCAEGGRGRGQGARRAQERRPCARPPLCQGDRAGVQRLHLFPGRRRVGEEAVDLALSRASRRLRRGGALQGAARRLGGVRHQSSLQHGLRAGHLPGVGELGAELRRGRVGARVGAAEPDPRHGRLFRAPRQLECALSQGAGALRAHGHHVGGGAGRVPRGRPHARWLAAPAQAGALELHGVGLRPQWSPRHRVRARRPQLRPRAGGPRPHGSSCHAQGRAPAFCLQSAGAVGVARAQPVAADQGADGTASAMPASASAGRSRSGTMSPSAASTSARCPSSRDSAKSSGWAIT